MTVQVCTFYRVRYYDPAAGRFLSKDPLNLGAPLGAYVYGDDNPISFSDPFGLQHTPGGPWHPAPWIKFACLGTDDCATLSWKIDTFKVVIASHMQWNAEVA